MKREKGEDEAKTKLVKERRIFLNSFIQSSDMFLLDIFLLSNSIWVLYFITFSSVFYCMCFPLFNCPSLPLFSWPHSSTICVCVVPLMVALLYQ